MRLDADQPDDVALQLAVRASDATALEDEVVGRPDKLANAIVDGDVRTLLCEVVERVGVDRTDHDGVVGGGKCIDRSCRCARHIEPTFEPNEHDRPLE
jgi:hypothetical protein